MSEHAIYALALATLLTCAAAALVYVTLRWIDIVEARMASILRERAPPGAAPTADEVRLPVQGEESHAFPAFGTGRVKGFVDDENVAEDFCKGCEGTGVDTTRVSLEKYWSSSYVERKAAKEEFPHVECNGRGKLAPVHLPSARSNNGAHEKQEL